MHNNSQVKEWDKKTVYTIGHSTRTLDEFVEMLKSHGIKTLVDIRSFPASRRYPQFNKENLSEAMPARGIKYLHAKDLGGRRKVRKDSKNNRWRNDSFRGYADYMETDEFENAAAKLEAIALESKTAYMCSEAVGWRCHRSMVSDYLKARGWDVEHIMDTDKLEEHPYTSPAVVQDGKVIYSDKELFD